MLNAELRAQTSSFNIQNSAFSLSSFRELHQRRPGHRRECIGRPSARELFGAIGCDERPHTAAKACPKASRRKRAEPPGTGGEPDRLQDLVSKERLRVRLRVDRELSHGILIALPNRINRL